MKQDAYRFPIYTGGVNPNCDYTHGQIPVMPGVVSVQITRANRTYPELADGTTTTYKHAADIAFFKGRFYVQYLVNPIDEHEPGGFSVITSAGTDLVFGDFKKSFPEYLIPECTVTDYKGLTHSFDGKTMAFMHQRMSFFKSSKDRMLVLGFYGWSPEKWMTNWDNYGIGRVVRELFPDGSMSDIFFIRPNYQGGWTDELLNYPLYDKAADKGFIEACEELLDNRLYTQQWAEENGDADDIITIKHPKGGTNQAFCWYHVDDERVVGLWKHSKVAASNDGGRTWSEVRVEPSLIMSGQKIWGQKCVSGVSAFGEASYALIYDPTLESTHRYPLCMISGKDGYHFDDMKLIHGEVPRKRYAGFWKDYGPQYMRGITEGIVTDPEDRKVLGDFIYLVYSVNKEDIWVSKIPYPKCPETDCGEVNGANGLNIYKPRFTDAEFIYDATGVISGVEVSDRDPVDHFVMSKVMKSASKQTVSLRISAAPIAEKPVYVELLDEKHIEAVRLIFKPEGRLCIRTVDDIDVCRYEPGKEYELTLSADCHDMYCDISFDDKNFRYRFYRAVNEISLLQIYTGKEYSSPTLTEDPEKQKDISYDTEKMHENASCFKAEEIRIHG